MDSRYPQQRSDVLLEMIGPEEAFLYNPASDAIHVLNYTALTVWNQCNGSRSIPEIGAHLQKVCRYNAATDVENDVLEIVGTFTELGVLV